MSVYNERFIGSIFFFLMIAIALYGRLGLGECCLFSFYWSSLLSAAERAWIQKLYLMKCVSGLEYASLGVRLAPPSPQFCKCRFTLE